MATFTNYATLSYNGGTTESNTVTGELLETLVLTKTAVSDTYSAKDTVTYVLSIVNSGSLPISALTVTDDLGAYTFNSTTLQPLSYAGDSLRYYLNGVLQSTAPTVTSGPPLVITGISVPAGGNAMLVYEADTTNYTPLGTEAEITNTAVLSGTALSTSLSATSTIAMEPRVDLNISKALCPVTIAENGQITYTFVIENSGSLAADASDQITLTDTFNPRLNGISVTFNGTAWTEGTNYTYNTTTGVFTTVPGQITVPSAVYTQNSGGTWNTAPGTATLIVTGTV